MPRPADEANLAHKLHVDKGYAYLRRRGIKARIAKQRVESSERLGRHRRRGVITPSTGR